MRGQDSHRRDNWATRKNLINPFQTRLTAFNVQCNRVGDRAVLADTDLIVGTDSELVRGAGRQVVDQRTVSRHKWHGRHPHAHPGLLELHRVPRDRFPAIELRRFPFQHER